MVWSLNQSCIDQGFEENLVAIIFRTADLTADYLMTTYIKQ